MPDPIRRGLSAGPPTQTGCPDLVKVVKERLVLFPNELLALHPPLDRVLLALSRVLVQRLQALLEQNVLMARRLV